ncbi:unnamed protein product [Symbiodinium sp. CCMP2592]|nr:unnamed protein product [Symbiodinium sp. CCMP2592]
MYPSIRTPRKGGLYCEVIFLVLAAVRRLRCSGAARRAVQTRPKKPATVRLTAAENHEIQVRVYVASESAPRNCDDEEEVSVSLVVDARCAGAVLLQRACSALQEEVACLWLPDGAELDVHRPLRVQGLKGGEVLVAWLPRSRAQKVSSRPVKAISEITYEVYHSEVKAFLHRFHLFVHDAEAVAEATEPTVEATFENYGFSLRIHGKSADFLLRRRVGPRVAALPVPFKVCPERCSVKIIPGKRVELVMRPFPTMWLNSGQRVRLKSLQATASLNGRWGTVDGFAEPSELLGRGESNQRPLSTILQR